MVGARGVQLYAEAALEAVVVQRDAAATEHDETRRYADALEEELGRLQCVCDTQRDEVTVLRSQLDEARATISRMCELSSAKVRTEQGVEGSVPKCVDTSEPCLRAWSVGSLVDTARATARDAATADDIRDQLLRTVEEIQGAKDDLRDNALWAAGGCCGWLWPRVDDPSWDSTAGALSGNPAIMPPHDGMGADLHC